MAWALDVFFPSVAKIWTISWLKRFSDCIYRFLFWISKQNFAGYFMFANRQLILFLKSLIKPWFFIWFKLFRTYRRTEKKKYFEIETWWISLLSSFVVHDWKEQITKLISYSFYWHISTIFFWQTHAQGGHGHLPTHFRFISFFLLDITYFFLDLSHWLLDKQQF